MPFLIKMKYNIDKESEKQPMKEVTIQNEFVKAVISEQAAEVISFKRKDNDLETIWCRDPAYWANCNPILFPYTGPLINNKYEYNGKTYELGQHGFARHAVFTITEEKEDSCTLVLEYSEETLKVYPFKFLLAVTYDLEGYRLNLHYSVVNLDSRKIPFDIGFHPAFNCPLTADKDYSDYRIEFEFEENLKGERRDGIVVPDGDSFPLDKYLVSGSFFYHDNQIKSNWAQLSDGDHIIRVGKEGFDTIGFWRKNEETPFMCIEPWTPHTDYEKVSFFRPDGVSNLLPVNETFKCSYYFELVK